VRGARFNTLDRPATGGRWGLLSRGKRGCRYNAEYLSQISAYVEAIHELGYPSERVFFELPHVALKLDLAILGDDGGVLVLGEAKRAVFMVDALLKEIQHRYSTEDPGEEGRNEARQLAWRLWRTRTPYFWFIGSSVQQVDARIACAMSPWRSSLFLRSRVRKTSGSLTIPRVVSVSRFYASRNRRTAQSTGPGLALLAPAGDRER
jgi:hypothetical protein